MKYLIFFVLAFASCATQKRCGMKFPLPDPEVIVRDSIREKTILRDTTIYIHLSADTVFSSDTLYIKGKTVSINPVTVQSRLAKARAWIDSNSLHLMLTDNDTTIETRLSSAIKESYFWQSKYKEEVRTLPPEKYIPPFWKVTGWMGIIWTALVALILIRKFR